MINTAKNKLTVPVKYVRNDNIIPFSSIDCTRELTIMPGLRRSIEIPLRSFVCIRAEQKSVKSRKIQWETIKAIR